ncbi:sensor histidine kinase/GAF domain hybrid protein [Flavobacterium limnosediminis JC2902]|uniref:histidine kinase n=1 Tax=Flavobacterium limnosediminis JC2902 TaxID=1341181 RepID=V6SGE5_9FLAO|nr:ATP-binding protein [Flavobacterium limnosediminis]ESU25773.1 sensor histidine kinase/GAF domain hybrid protein [Flavobacterium limnosediminis JC2902]
MILKENDILHLKLLEEYKILDTLPEQMYDDITALAASICNAPMALISMIDEHRQFFKSHFGTDISQTPIKHSICRHAISSGQEYFEITDLRTDNRFKENPLVTEDPKIVSYFGVPLVSEEGIAFGTLCIFNTVSQQLNDRQRKAVVVLASQVVHLLELRKKNFLLEAYRKKLDSYSSDMEEFAFIAAHDLRSPLRGINSFLKMLESKNITVWDEKDRVYLNFIYENVQRMDKLVLDLLDYAKTHMNHSDEETINVKKLATDLFEGLTKGTETPRPELSVSEIPEITTSRIALTIVFQNLIANALKYQLKENTPKIEISHSETKTEWIFEVRDNGIGIEQEYLPVIFQPFKRLHNQSEYNGSGLGLAACKTIIKNLNGSISVKSEKNKGSIFTFTLPK